MCKPDQSELQLDRSKLSYLEHSSPMQQETVQPKITKGPPHFLVCKFPSLRQFQTRKLIVTGGADEQPPPILKFEHPPLKPVISY